MRKIIFFLLPLLLASSFSYAEKYKWHTNMKKQEKKDFSRYVLKAQSKNKMVFNTRNAPNENGLYKFFDKFEDHMGVAEQGIEFNLKYSNKGYKHDWNRWGKPGHAQRFQIMEPYKHTTKKGKTKWYRVGYFVPKDIRTDEHTISLFVLKGLEHITTYLVVDTQCFVIECERDISLSLIMKPVALTPEFKAWLCR